MCWSCGCGRPSDDHGDSRSITTETMQAAAAQCGCDVPSVVGNIAKTLSLHRGRQAGRARKEDGLGFAVVKSEEERQFLLLVAYPANKADVGIAADGFRDFASKEVVERAAWRFMLHGAQMGRWHRELDPETRVVESSIHRGPAYTTKAVDGSEQTVEPGDWLVGVLCGDETWRLHKQGLIGGASPQGGARRRTPSPEAVANLRR